MIWFEHREDVEEWLRPLDYDAFWRETERYDLAIETRQSCDAQIATSEIDETTVLTALKALAIIELVDRYALRRRSVDRPFLSVH